MAESGVSLSGAVDIVKEAWAVLTSKFNQLWLLALVAFIPSGLSALLSSKEPVDEEKLKATFEAGNFSNFNGVLESTLGVSLAQFGIMVLVLVIASFSWLVFAQGANISNTLAVMRDKKADVNVDTIITGGTKHFGRLFVAFVAVGLVVAVGFLLLVIPGIIAIFLLGFTFYFIVDKDMTLGDAMRSSYELAKNNVSSILYLMVVLLGVGIGVAIVNSIVIAILPSARLDDLAAGAIDAVFSVLTLLAAARLYLNLTKSHRLAKPAQVVSE